MSNSNSVSPGELSVGLGSKIKSLFAAIVIPTAIIAGFIIRAYILGDPRNFEKGDPNLNPLPGNYLGMIYKGGYIVPVLMAILMIVITFSIERFLTLVRARGRASVSSFIKRVQYQLTQNNFNAAEAECDKQKGSVANVIKAGLQKCREMEKEKNMDRDQKVLAIQKEIEEATALELPMLEKNLVILATIAPLATLMGLLGTVLGMIRAFAALAHSGAPDAVALATGISEALINTAFGIGSSALAIIMYNYFTSVIDRLTYSIDEGGFSIIQTFAAQHKIKEKEMAYVSKS